MYDEGGWRRRLVELVRTRRRGEGAVYLMFADDDPGPTSNQTATLPAERRGVGVTVEIIDRETRLSRSERASVGRLADAAMAALGQIEGVSLRGEVCVRLVGDDEMRSMHAKHLDQDSTTDILTFDLGSDAAAGLLDADLVVCVDEAMRQATRRGVALEHELALYIVHGVLHCLGHDDHDDVGYARMHGLEDRVLVTIGLSPVFSAPERPRRESPGRTESEGGAC